MSRGELYTVIKETLKREDVDNVLNEEVANSKGKKASS